MSATVYKPAEYIGLNPRKIAIFLGGSIELGTARDWQNELIQYLSNGKFADKLEILNPRRDDWDPTWSIDDPNHEQLAEQINWELYYQDKADVLVYNFSKGTVSPITLLELGTYSPRNPIIHIEGGYKRHANVKITADHFGWEYHEDWEKFLTALDQRIALQVAFRQNVLSKFAE